MTALSRHTVLAALLGCCATSPGIAAANACGPVADALRRSYEIPYHQSLTQIEDGKRTQSEMLFDGKSLFMKMNGQWFDAGAMDNPFKELTAGALKATSCTRLRDEAVASQPATLYQVTQVVDGRSGQSQSWVSAAGLVLRMRDANTGDFDLTADYAGIKAPAGARRIGT